MDYYLELLPMSDTVAQTPEAHLFHYFDVLDRAVGIAVKNRCGVRIMFYSNGDIVITSTNKVTFGTIKEELEAS